MSTAVVVAGIVIRKKISPKQRAISYAKKKSAKHYPYIGATAEAVITKAWLAGYKAGRKSK